MIEAFNGAWHFEIQPKRGRLHVDITTGTRAMAPKDLLSMTLTARGPCAGHDQLVAGLHLGRETVVRAFAELTSDAAHTFWGRTK